ncbi:MAG: NUDIX hydrolase [Bacilli bacterium]|jgi:ADP-ribose pyrophosphatase|nr:NUDIX hydrolase [Bacilli bacterium]
MKWTLKEVIQETNHPFLNYFTLVYDVEKPDGHHTYSYYMASRHSKEELVCFTKNVTRPDGVVIPLYYKDPKSGQLALLMTSQFRPPLNKYVTSFPAGLMDKTDSDIFEVAKREAREEVGADIADLELLAPPSPTSSGLSDELNSIVLARLVGFENRELEEFEDIGYRLVPMQQVKDLLDSPDYFFAMQIRMIIKYLLERFKGQY